MEAQGRRDGRSGEKIEGKRDWTRKWKRGSNGGWIKGKAWPAPNPIPGCALSPSSGSDRFAGLITFREYVITSNLRQWAGCITYDTRHNMLSCLSAAWIASRRCLIIGKKAVHLPSLYANPLTPNLPNMVNVGCNRPILSGTVIYVLTLALSSISHLRLDSRMSKAE